MAVQKRSEASAFSASETAPMHSAVRRDGTPPGFRHFLGTPRASQRFRVFGIDPLEAPEHLSKIRGLMNRLSRRMDAKLSWPVHADATVERWENPRLPSGYTYLLQFVAHDLVHSAIPLSVAGSLGADTANARRTALKLETLYGNGPVSSPFVYAQDTPNDERRTKLRLGRMRWDDKDVEPGCPFRDIARTPAENITGIDRSIAGHRVALTEALIADPRNDDHAIMSQLTALFALLHNGLIDIVRRGEPAAGPNASLGAAYKRFLCARDALTLIYHNIIRKDLMRRVIHPAIYAAYSGPIPNFIDRPSTSTAVRTAAAREPAAGKSLWNFPTARSASATPWFGLNTSSTICRPMISTTPWKRIPRTIPSTCHSIRPGSYVGRASSKSTDRGRISAGASARFSATGWATSRYFLPSI